MSSNPCTFSQFNSHCCCPGKGKELCVRQPGLVEAVQVTFFVFWSGFVDKSTEGFVDSQESHCFQWCFYQDHLIICVYVNK